VDKKGNTHSNDPLTIAVEEQVEFTCETDDIESNPEVSVFTFFICGEQRKSHDNSIWDPVFRSVNNTGTYTCKANNSLGESEISNDRKVVVQGKFKAEEHSEACICMVDLCYSYTSLKNTQQSCSPVSHYMYSRTVRFNNICI